MDLPFAGDVSRTPTLVMDDSRPGDIVGTPEFMSPEQARGNEIDNRTDIWAFGCILFEMLSGKRAFTGETIPDVLARDPRPRTRLGRASGAHAAAGTRAPARCLQKDPTRRLRDAGDARIELDVALGRDCRCRGVRAPVIGPEAAVASSLAAAAVAVMAVAAFLCLRPG